MLGISRLLWQEKRASARGSRSTPGLGGRGTGPPSQKGRGGQPRSARGREACGQASLTPCRQPPRPPGVPDSHARGLTEEAPFCTFRSEWRCRPQAGRSRCHAHWAGGRAGSRERGQPARTAPGPPRAATVSGACGRRAARGEPLGGHPAPHPSTPACLGPPAPLTATPCVAAC